eukprot:scaffold7583_cov118-Isochrysis_galbana.AAC.8
MSAANAGPQPAEDDALQSHTVGIISPSSRLRDCVSVMTHSLRWRRSPPSCAFAVCDEKADICISRSR